MTEPGARKPLLERVFHLTAMGTNVRTELMAGLTTFMTMSYIIAVQPAILSDPNGAAMPKDALITATCLSSALACLLMAFLANYPIALAPGMGENVYFSMIVCGMMGVAWQTALGAVFIAGAIFVILSLFGFRGLSWVPSSLLRRPSRRGSSLRRSLSTGA